MKTIWKFPLRIADVQHITATRGAQFLSAQRQGDELVVWALVDPNAPTLVYAVQIIGTGYPIATDQLFGMRHLSTVQYTPSLVWHVFVPGDE